MDGPQGPQVQGTIETVRRITTFTVVASLSNVEFCVADSFRDHNINSKFALEAFGI